MDGAERFDLFFPAIILSALYGGYGPSVLAALLSTLGLAFFIIPPYNSFNIGTGDVLRLVVFARFRRRDLDAWIERHRSGLPPLPSA